jgi:putative transposase
MTQVIGPEDEQERAGSPRSGEPRPLHSGWRTRGYLPHYDEAGTVQHIVFRLADALPAKVLRDLENAPCEIRLDAAEATLDAGVGCRALADPRIAALVATALLHFDAERYRLLAWCVMPTHVHLLAEELPGWPLATVVHGLKSFTANAANRALGRTGALWAPEYFDRMMRGPDQHERAIAYIEANPVVAGLCQTADTWRWSSANASASSVPGAQASSLHLRP